MRINYFCVAGFYMVLWALLAFVCSGCNFSSYSSQSKKETCLKKADEKFRKCVIMVGEQTSLCYYVTEDFTQFCSNTFEAESKECI